MSNKRICRACNGISFRPVINMGKQPLVNSLLTKEECGLEPTFPLVVEQCEQCALVQIVEPIDSNKIYRNVDYLYFSGDMPGLRDYFKEYANELKERFIKEGDFIVEIGSNDGTMLDLFEGDMKILGVDPASNTVVRALRNHIPTLSDAFTERIAASIAREYGHAKLIYGNNCIAHIDDLYDLLRGVENLLNDNGVFVVECNYWGGMVKNKNYSLIYHDHFSYFTVATWIKLAQRFGLNAFDAYVTPAQGGSLRIFFDKGLRIVTSRFKKLIVEEERTGLNTYKTCINYRQDCIETATKLRKQIENIKSKGEKIAGYGAAAKGFSILSFAGITGKHLDYFVDDSPAKQGKYAPVSHIPVISRQYATKVGLPDYFLITAPNYADIIMEKEKEFINSGGRFIVPK